MGEIGNWVCKLEERIDEEEKGFDLQRKKMGGCRKQIAKHSKITFKSGVDFNIRRELSNSKGHFRIIFQTSVD